MSLQNSWWAVQEYNALRDQWVREGRGFLLVYSIDNKQSFEEIDAFRDRILIVNEEDHSVPMVLVGNKCDKEEDREVSTAEGNALAAKFKIPFVECSALKVFERCTSSCSTLFSIYRFPLTLNVGLSVFSARQLHRSLRLGGKRDSATG